MITKNLKTWWQKNKQKLISVIRPFAFIIIILFSFPVILRIAPFPELNDFCSQEYSCRIYDRNNELIQVTTVDDGKRREFTPIKKIPKQIQKEFIRQEDKRFYLHHGVDWLSIFSAVFQNLRANKAVRGGSTITMQIAKAVNQDKSHTIKRKIKDVFYAYRIEAKLSKKKILEIYLNTIYFGKNSYGVTSAARTYFGCELNQLSKGQAQVLSYIPRNPSFYNPVEHPKRYEEVSEQAAQAAYSAYYFSYPFKLPHFVNSLSKDSYEVHTTVDLEISRMAEGFLREALDQASTSRITNGSLLLIENKTGQVIAWLGNGDFFDAANSGQIDGVLVRNQPGSSMKPFLYALAIENNLIEPSTVLADVPKEFGSEKLYIPENFNNRFNGPVRTRIALASSLNVPAVSILNDVGVPVYLDKLYELGFESLRENGNGLRADLGLALGAGEVSLRELVPAFSVFVRDGKYIEPQTIINNSKKMKITERQVYSSDTARLICSILSDKGARSLGFGYTQTFQTDYPSIFKTGTSNQYQDIVALGATKNFTVGVWMGNFAGQTVMGKTGSSLPAWVAKNILDKLENGHFYNPDMEFEEPEHWHKERICSVSGMKAGENCLSVVTEYVKDSDSLSTCTWHTKINGEVQTVYPSEYQQWARIQKSEALIDYSNSPLTILSPQDGTKFYYSELNKNHQAITFEITGGTEDTLQIFYDEKKHADISRPFIFSLPVERGNHICKIICGSEEQELNYQVY